MAQGQAEQLDGRIESVTVRDTSAMSMAEITSATNATFEQYFVPIAHTPSQFAEFCRCYAMDAAESVRMDNRHGRLIGLAMLGLRGHRGWCGGLGLVPEYRGLGLGKRLVDALVGRARLCGLRSMQLEVLSQNQAALRTYARCGFQTRRELASYWGDATKAIDSHAERAVEQPVHSVSVEMALGLASMESGCAAAVWSREAASLLTLSHSEGIILGDVKRPSAAAVYRTPPGGPLEIGHLTGIDQRAQRALLSSIAGRWIARNARCASYLSVLDEPCDSPLSEILINLGFQELYRQRELLLTL